MDNWQPIETAPKDGSWFLVCNFNSPMCWAPYEFASWGWNYNQNPITGEWDVKIEPGFYQSEDTSEPTEGTFWMPLPKPPVSA